MSIYLLPPELQADPEVTAMLQAYYSRSSKKIFTRLTELGFKLSTLQEQVVRTDLLEKVRASLRKYYIGYGHDSIGQCGFTTIFIEDVSLLAEKIFQDNPLFNGQASSTRFMDFSDVTLVRPSLGTQKHELLGATIQEAFFQLYLSLLPLVTDLLYDYHSYESCKNNVSILTEEDWSNAIKARAFDICRSLLPAGIRTNLSFTASLQNFRENLSILKNHPLLEVANESGVALDALHNRFPDAFAEERFTEYQNDFYRANANEVFFSMESQRPEPMLSRFELVSRVDNKEYLTNVLGKRPRGVKVPFHLGRFSHFETRFLLDYGSFRDYQRHRNCKTPLPVLTTRYGFHPWYLEQFRELRHDISMQVKSSVRWAKDMMYGANLGPEELVQMQYAIPIGFQVPVVTKLDLDEIIYIAELRSSKHVHPTLRPIAHKFAEQITLALPRIPLYIDKTEDMLQLSRGKQTIKQVEDSE